MLVGVVDRGTVWVKFCGQDHRSEFKVLGNIGGKAFSAVDACYHATQRHDGLQSRRELETVNKQQSHQCSLK